jgi:hypothetical protein
VFGVFYDTYWNDLSNESDAVERNDYTRVNSAVAEDDDEKDGGPDESVFYNLGGYYPSGHGTRGLLYGAECLGCSMILIGMPSAAYGRQ